MLLYQKSTKGSSSYRLRQPSIWLYVAYLCRRLLAAANMIAALSSIFAIEVYTKTMVSDNGPQPTADAFEEFPRKISCRFNPWSSRPYRTKSTFRAAFRGQAFSYQEHPESNGPHY